MSLRMTESISGRAMPLDLDCNSLAIFSIDHERGWIDSSTTHELHLLEAFKQRVDLTMNICEILINNPEGKHHSHRVLECKKPLALPVSSFASTATPMTLILHSRPNLYHWALAFLATMSTSIPIPIWHSNRYKNNILDRAHNCQLVQCAYMLMCKLLRLICNILYFLIISI